ncbi:MAG: DUF1579 family protein [Rhizobacter sp.]|nr:DUF1579 family protein [Rhizobacter sp.]
MTRSLPRPMRRLSIALGAALCLHGAARAAEPAPPAEVYRPIALEAGTWDADVTFYEADKPSGQARGTQVNALLANGHWLTNDFRIPASDKFPAYQGHGVWGYDPVAKTYVNTWVDTNDRTVRTDYGYWQAGEQTMVWSSKQSDGNGHFIDYRMVEEFKGDTRVFTVYQLGIVKPNPHPLVKIVFTRRAGA